MTQSPCILCCAITGSVATKADNPAVPTSIQEQIESSHEAVEAGAAIIHAHVRNKDQSPSSDPDKFSVLKEGLEKHCPGVIIQFSTGGRSGAGRTRGGMLSLRPDMASLSVGSNNFPNRVYENPPDLVEWLSAEMVAHEITPEVEAFDLSHILHAIDKHQKGQLFGKLYVQFVLGVKNAMPTDKAVFDFYVSLMAKRAPEAAWCAAGIGANQLIVNEWAIAAGGHTRAGLEDNVRLDRQTLAPSNAALIARAADLCAKYERPVASPAQARQILDLRA
ncbi:MAG: 3-keto-5-aminohexanoate cleavage protein [Paracoccaceae bacterium]|nr:3-keto-5-aminohexanoate cleavage protein [Paracoccaceae bacterium]